MSGYRTRAGRRWWLLWVVLQPAAAAELPPAVFTQALAQAMTHMLQALGMMTPAVNAPDHPAVLPFSDPVRLFSLPNTAAAMANTAPSLWQATSLEGIWEDRSGNLFIVQGARFRLYQLNSGYVDGLIQQRGGRVALYNPNTGMTRAYECAESEGRLVLRDDAGQLFLYRRLWANQSMPVDVMPPSQR